MGRYARARRLVALAVGAALLALLAIGGSSGSPPAAQAQTSCVQPRGLTPDAASPANFTMLIRINTQGNVDTYTKPEGGMGGRIRPQDIFVLNTRFAGSAQFPAMTSAVAADLAADLHATFPCNRIIALNGMSFDPAQPGYAFAAIEDPNVFALLTDYEQTDWNCGTGHRPDATPLDRQVQEGLPAAAGVELRLHDRGRGEPGRRRQADRAGPPGPRRAGTTGRSPRTSTSRTPGSATSSSARRAFRRRTPAPMPGPRASAARAKQLRLQYTFKFITKKVEVQGKRRSVKKTFRQPLKKKGKPLLSNLAMEISFTDTPDRALAMAILRTSPAQAAACVGPAMKQGVGAFLFFASDDAMRLLFQQPQIAALRPAAAGSASTGGVGSPR